MSAVWLKANGDIMIIVEETRSNVWLEDFRRLKWFAANLASAAFTGIVLYTGSTVLRFGDGFYAVSMSMLSC